MADYGHGYWSLVATNVIFLGARVRICNANCALGRNVASVIWVKKA